MALTYTPARTPEDIHALSAMADHIWHEFFPSILEEEQISYMVDKFLSPSVLTEQLKQGYEYYFTEDDKQNRLGFIVVHPEEKRLFLSKIYLYKEARGNGYASRMLDFVASLAKDKGLDAVYLTVNKYNSAEKVYAHKGYKTIDAVVTDIGHGYVMDDYIMELAV